jgi:prepilin-type processing-associated H-X9-DG protein
MRPASDGTNTVDVCYTAQDIAFRHGGMTIMSYLDTHVATSSSLPLGDSNTFTSSGTAPTLIQNGPGNLPAISFPGTYAPLQCTAGVGFDWNDSDYSIVMVRSMGAASGQYDTLFSVPGQVVSYQAIDMKTSGTPPEDDYPAVSTSELWSLSMQGNTVSVSENLVPQPVTTGSGPFVRSTLSAVGPVVIGADPLNFGSPTSGAFPATMQVSEILFFQQPLSAQQLAAVYAQLKTKYSFLP